MLVSEKIKCISACSCRGCSRPRFGSHTGSESSFTSLTAANAVLKLMSAVIAIAHVLFVSIKSLSVKIMLLEYSFVKLKK